MKEFNHFIITRFNLKSNTIGWVSDKNNKEIRTDSWLKHRLSVFTKYCLPSVANQTQKDFNWVIFIDNDTKQFAMDQFNDIASKYKFIHFVKVADYNEFQNTYLDHCFKIDGNCEYLITTRLDNDDLVAENYIEEIQSRFDHQDYMAVNFIKILMLTPEDSNKLYIDYQFSNHFISLIEKNDRKCLGVYSKKDSEWNAKGRIIHIGNKIVCAETISSRNMFNYFRGFPVLLQKNMKHFGLNKSFKQEWSLNLFIKCYQWSWKKMFKYILKLY